MTSIFVIGGFLAIMNGLAIAIWSGGWSWVMDFESQDRREQDVALPWAVLGIDVWVGGLYLARDVLHVDSSFDRTIVVLGLPFMAIAAAIFLVGRPRLALPRWYRERQRTGWHRDDAVVARTIWQRLRRDHVWWLVVLVPVTLFSGYGAALAGCSRAAISESPCAQAILDTTRWALVGSVLVTFVAYRAGWLATLRGAKAERGRDRSARALALSMLLAPGAYALLRASPLSSALGVYLTMDALVILFGVITAGRAIALVSEARRKPTVSR